jgi:hypothetical protein
MGIVRVSRGQVAQRRFALDMDVIFVMIHFERRFGCVHNSPHHYGRNLDRVTVMVIDLEARRLKVPDAQRHRLPAGKRIHPVQPRGPHSPGVLAKQLYNDSLVRVDDEQPCKTEKFLSR